MKKVILSLAIGSEVCFCMNSQISICNANAPCINFNEIQGNVSVPYAEANYNKSLKNTPDDTSAVCSFLHPALNAIDGYRDEDPSVWQAEETAGKKNDESVLHEGPSVNEETKGFLKQFGKMLNTTLNVYCHTLSVAGTAGALYLVQKGLNIKDQAYKHIDQIKHPIRNSVRGIKSLINKSIKRVKFLIHKSIEGVKFLIHKSANGIRGGIRKFCSVVHFSATKSFDEEQWFDAKEE